MMNNQKISIHNMPLWVLDALIIYLQSGQGDRDLIRSITKDLREVRQNAENEINKRKAEIQEKPTEEEYKLSANPVSAEHIE